MRLRLQEEREKERIMVKTTLQIDGMVQGLCESRICNVICDTIPEAKMVSASYTKGKAVFFTEDTVDVDTIKKAIDTSGYTCRSVLSKYLEEARAA